MKLKYVGKNGTKEISQGELEMVSCRAFLAMISKTKMKRVKNGTRKESEFNENER